MAVLFEYKSNYRKPVVWLSLAVCLALAGQAVWAQVHWLGWMFPALLAVYAAWLIFSGSAFGIKLTDDGIERWIGSRRDEALYEELDHVVVRDMSEGWDLKFVRKDGASLWFETGNTGNRAAIIGILTNRGIAIRRT